MKKSVSIIVPAYNEEGNIISAISDAKAAVKALNNWEMVVVDDGSTDKTGLILEKIARHDPRIRIITHAVNMGFGQTIKDGIAASRKEYITQFHGDNDAAGESLRLMLDNLGKEDLVVSYTVDSRTRSPARRIVSKMFAVAMNMIFGMNLRYFNGCFLCKRKLLQSINLTSSGFAIYAEAKVRLIKAGASIIEVPFNHVGRKHGKSKAVSIKSVIETLITILLLINDIYFRKSYQQSIKPQNLRKPVAVRETIGT